MPAPLTAADRQTALGLQHRVARAAVVLAFCRGWLIRGEAMDEHELKRAADVGLAQREADKRTVERMQTIALRLFCVAFFLGLCGWLLNNL